MKKLFLLIFFPLKVCTQTNFIVNSILEDVYFWDQCYRQSKNSCSKQDINTRDSVNLKNVTYIISNFGFPTDTSIYSFKAIKGIYYTIQHSDILTQTKYLSDIKKLADNNILSQKMYAMTFDRILVRKTGKQKYGEQRYLDSTDNYLKYFPFLNIDSVQFYRKQLDLEPIDLNKKTKVFIILKTINKSQKLLLIK